MIIVTASCAREDPPRVEANVNVRAPAVIVRNGIRYIHSFAAREMLTVSDDRLDTSSRLLFLKSRPSQPRATGGVSWLDLEHNRILVVDDGGMLLHELPPDSMPGQYRGMTVETRSALEYSLTAVRAGEPLIRLLSEDGTVIRDIGVVDTAGNAALGQLVNAGPAAFGPDGSVYFAAALRPEIRRYDDGGRLRWVATWETHREVPRPRLVARDGTLHADFSILQHGVAVGPDGHVYVLATMPGQDSGTLLVFDRDGEWLRSADADPNSGLFVNRRGAAFTVAAEQAIGADRASARPPFEPFSLPALLGPDTLRLEAYRGRVVVLNFWASWCGPCRSEMPLLEQLAHEADTTELAVLGLNEDTQPERGRAFLREVGVTFPSAEGHGRLKQRYHYHGLPYTVVLDRNLRVIRTIHGFGGDIDAVRAAIATGLQTR